MLRRLLAAMFLALFLCSGCVQEQGEAAFRGVDSGIVERVIDGDTFVLANGERVRLIGINAPEKGEECREEAKNRLHGLVSGKLVVLEKDVSERDRYGRLVRFVYADGLFVNLALVEEGLAFAFAFEPDVSKAGFFRSAELAAMDGNGCLWRPA